LSIEKVVHGIGRLRVVVSGLLEMFGSDTNGVLELLKIEKLFCSKRDGCYK